jgi:hypothetical protein
MKNCMKKFEEEIANLLKCTKKNIDGSICGKKYGTCIHKWIPTKFGAHDNA